MPLDLPALRVDPFATAAACRAALANLLEPPPSLDVAQAAEVYRVLSNPGGGYSGPWRNAFAPYLTGPMQALTDPRYEIVVFLGPAQSGKTEIGLNWMTWSVAVDPADLQIVLPEKQQAEDFSKRRVDRAVVLSPALSELSGQGEIDTKFVFDFGRCLVNLSWPTSSNASSKPVPRNWLDERDSMADDIDGEGDPVELYHKRSQTFGARRKTLVTTSIKRPPVKGAARPRGKHELPATVGAVALYNSGTRRHMYWRCRREGCGHWFVTRVADLIYAEGARSDDQRIAVHFACPACEHVHGEEDRKAMWAERIWLAEDEEIDNGTVAGHPRVTSVDSYWLSGAQAAFISLEELVRKKLKAEEHRQLTGSDTLLKAFWNVDANEVYVPAAGADTPLSADELRDAAKGPAGDLALGILPSWATLALASVDIQADRFEIQWHAVGPDGESAIVDHQRLIAIAPDGSPVLINAGPVGMATANLEACDPARRSEHWHALVRAVFDRILPFAHDPGHGLRPMLVAIDSNGPSGTTGNAYRFARWLRRNRSDIAGRAMFIRGRGRRNPVRVSRAMWDPRTTPARVAAARRHADVWDVWVNELKDTVDARLRRAVALKGERGSDALHLSRYLPPAVFEQIVAETLDGDVWVNERHVANEGLDLAVYALAAWIRLGGDRIDWSNPPAWLDPQRCAVAIENPVIVLPAMPSVINPVRSAVPPPPVLAAQRRRGDRGRVQLGGS